MSIPLEYSVRKIEPYQCKEWLIYKHYAKRLPSISYAFGLYDFDKNIVGVLTVGKPASYTLCNVICGEEYSNLVYELNRLCVNDGLPKNALSYFVSQCLSYLNSKEDMILVSFADSKMNHHGYIYQATNWIYTGFTKERTDIGVDGGIHGRHTKKGADANTPRRKRSSKYRYIYFLGKNRKKVAKELKYPILPYPKGENQRYDSTHQITVQTSLF